LLAGNFMGNSEKRRTSGRWAHDIRRTEQIENLQKCRMKVNQSQRVRNSGGKKEFVLPKNRAKRRTGKMIKGIDHRIKGESSWGVEEILAPWSYARARCG